MANNNRRLGDRVRPDGLSVIWVVPGTQPDAKREKKRSPKAKVTNLSFSGIQVEAPLHKKLSVGTSLAMLLRGIPTIGEIKWIETDGHQAGMGLYGLAFTHLSPALQAVITDIVVECNTRDGIRLAEEPPDRKPFW